MSTPDVIYTENEERTEFSITRHHGLTSSGNQIELTYQGWRMYALHRSASETSLTYERAVSPECAAGLITGWKKEAGVTS